MFCYKCGAENRDDAAFCSNCGTQLSQKEPELQNNTVEKPKGFLERFGLFVAIAVALLLIMVISIFFSIANQVDGERYIKVVSASSPSGHSNSTYGDVFASTFTKGTWKYFKGTGNKDVVEYNAENTDESSTTHRIRIQFTVESLTDKTVKMGAFVIDNHNYTVGQADALIEAMFANYEGKGSSKLIASSSAQELSNVQQAAGGETGADGGGALNSEYIIPNSDKIILTENDLKNLSAKELTYARNEVYARHGYLFEGELDSYFRSKSWYQPGNDNAKIIINSVEEANVKLIKEYQQVNGKTYAPWNNPMDSNSDFSEGNEGAVTEISDIGGLDLFCYRPYNIGNNVIMHLEVTTVNPNANKYIMQMQDGGQVRYIHGIGYKKDANIKVGDKVLFSGVFKNELEANKTYEFETVGISIER